MSGTELDYRVLGTKTEWLRSRMSQSSETAAIYKIIAGAVFIFAIVLMLLVFGQAIAAILGGQAGSASEYAFISQANQFILQIAVVAIGGAAIPAFLWLAAQPTHLLISSSGLRFVARRLLPVNRRMLPWQEIDAIELIQSTRAGAADYLLFKSASKRNPLRVKLTALSHEDRAHLLESIQRWAPMAVQEPAVLRALTTNKDQTYTELWLQAFTAAPKRESMTPLLAGALINNKYKVKDHLGMGGQGTAYLATDDLHQNVVLKEFVLPVFVDATIRRQALKSFENEARILKSLDHDNVVKLLDFFVADQRAYLILEYVDGPTLKKLVEERGPLPEREAAQLALQATAALQHLHSQSPPVVHRDVAPDNLVLSKRGVLKLVDFNVAHQSASSHATSVVGKQAYLPPEQFRGEPTPQSDIYALGGTLFFLLTGKEPEAISVSRPKLANPLVSDVMDGIVAKATALTAAKRYATAELMNKDLSAVILEHAD